MKHIFHNIQHTARAATVLLLALLAAQTAGAQEFVSDAGGLALAFQNTNVSVINVTDNITGVGILPSINRALTINLNGHTISGDGLHIDVDSGCSLTINGEGQDGSVGNIISGNANQSAIDNNGGTVTLSHVNITTNSQLAIGSYGMLNIGNSVSFNGWTGMPFDTPRVNIIEGGNYNYAPGNPRANVVATVTVGGVTHYFENLSVALVYINNNADKVDFSWSESDDTYTIHTATGWDFFCDLQEGGETFSGKTVKLDANIGTPEDPVTRMGSSTTQFQGTFDGDGHTLTVQYGTASEPVDQQFVAPFPVVADATFRNLTIAGSIYVDYYTTDENPQPGVGGLIGHLFGGVTIEGCTSTVEITSTRDRVGGFVGLCEHSVSFTDCVSSAVVHYSRAGNISGFVGWSRASEYTISFEGCLFNGKLLLDNGQWYGGGFVGWKGDGKTVNITNCLYAPPIAADEEYESGGATFCIQHDDKKPAVITNSYYTHTLGAAQGKQARAVTAGTDVTIEAIALTGDATAYTVSGITAYSGGGLQRGETLYYGIDDVVSLTLSNTATGAPDGYQYGYTTNAGTLSGSTLTMPDQDVTVSLALTWTGDGTEDNPYIIYNKDQLDLLAYRVNGTHGETANDYYNTYFKLDKDIKYTPTTDWDDAECEQENNYEAIGGYYGDDYRYFRGHFDGNKKTISGIRIYKDGTGYADYYQGIFGRTDEGADIHDLTLADARITGYGNTGGIVGYNVDGKVTHCHVAGDVAVCAVQSYVWYHGGIVGENGGTIEQCTSAATLTIANAANSRFYGGIAGYNSSRGTLSDNLAIGATVPAAADNNYGAITGENNGTLQRNYYANCNVNDTPNATGVGCGHISNDDDGYTTDDVNNDNNPNGARAVFALTLAEGITTTTAATVTIGTTGYYAQGTAIALSYSGAPDGYSFNGYTVSGGNLEGSTLTMPDQDVTVSPALRSTGEAVEEVSYVDAGGTAQKHDAIALDGTESGLGMPNQETWYFVGLPTVAFDHTLNLNGNVHLILADGCTMNVTNSKGNGIDINGSLTIYGQTDGTGTLNATGGNGAGITTYSGTITISGGRVTATGDNGIFTNSGTITISGGRVTATGGVEGINTYSGDISISGGRVTASGFGAGIITNSGTITLGCTTASDFIYVSSYVVGFEDRLNIAGGQTLSDEDGNYYSGTINDYDLPNGKTLRLYGIGLAARKAPDGNYWTTYYNSAQGFTIEGNACAYTATYGAGQLTLHNLGKEIPKNTAVIIVADNSVVSMTATDLPAYSGGTNNLRGVDYDTQTSALGTGTFYVLGMTTVGGEKHFGFHRYTGEEMAAHKAYVLVDNSQARSLTMVFDEATGIESLTPDAAPKAQAAQHWFTLDGRRLQAKPTAPGIYINNGRKVVIK